MAAKRITWITETKFEVEILDGIATGKYQVDDIEDYKFTPCAGMIQIGKVGTQRLMIKTEDIPDYKAHYSNTPKALRTQREDLVMSINGCYSDAQYAQNKSYESGDGTGRFVNAGDKYLAKAELIKKQLAIFDTAHPEVIAKIEVEKKESVARHMWD